MRDDGGIYEGADVSVYYDPMISKFAVYGRDREQAIQRMRCALMEYQVGGIKTTLPFFREVMDDPEFVAGNLDTGFIEGFRERRNSKDAAIEGDDLAIVAAALRLSDAKQLIPAAGQNTMGKLSRWAAAGRNSQLNDRK